MIRLQQRQIRKYERELAGEGEWINIMHCIYYVDAYVYIILTIDDTEMTSFLDTAADCDSVHLQASLVAAELRPRPRPSSQEVGVSRDQAILLRSGHPISIPFTDLPLNSAPASDDEHRAGDLQPRQGGHSRGANTVPGHLGSEESYVKTLG